MNFFKRAIASIIRRPGKTAILLIFVFILGSVIAGAIAVNGAIANTDVNLRRNMQPIMSIDFDQQAFLESDIVQNWDAADPHGFWQSAPSLMVAQVREIGQLPQIAFYDYSMAESRFKSFDLEYAGMSHFRLGDEPVHIQTIRGTNSTNMVQIESGSIILRQGRQFEAADMIPGTDEISVIISEDFAYTNQLSLGSSFEMFSIIQMPGHRLHQHWYREEYRFDKIAFSFNVIGLFVLPEEEDTQQDAYFLEHNNRIYMPNWAIEEFSYQVGSANLAAWEASDYETPEGVLLENDIVSGPLITPIFVLEDPLLMDEFREAAANLLPDFHHFTDLASTFDDIAPSMQTMRNIANWILWTSIGATLLILSLLITLFLRDRRYEMGVYLAIGEKKGKIVSQILLEIVTTSFVGITLAVFAGNIISAQVSQSMLVNELQATRAEQDANNDQGLISEWTAFDSIGIPANDMSIEEMVDAFEVSLTLQTVGLFYVVGLGAVILSTLSPVIYIVTLNPKKVLM